jgi:hypothetical protein
VKWLTTTCSSLLLLGLSATAAAPPDPLSRCENQQPSWAACPFPATDGEQPARCALVTVARDWADPLSGVDMAVHSRVAATGESLGAILVYPGGPSVPGTSLAGELAGLSRWSAPATTSSAWTRAAHALPDRT